MGCLERLLNPRRLLREGVYLRGIMLGLQHKSEIVETDTLVEIHKRERSPESDVAAILRCNASLFSHRCCPLAATVPPATNIASKLMFKIWPGTLVLYSVSCPQARS